MAVARRFDRAAAALRERWESHSAGIWSVLIAELSGEPVGFVIYGADTEMPGLMHLSDLAVATGVRNRGVGTRLVEAVEQASRQRRLSGVWLDVEIDNGDAERLYRRLGYEQTGELVRHQWVQRRFDGSEQEVTEVCHRMLKRLA